MLCLQCCNYGFQNVVKVATVEQSVATVNGCIRPLQWDPLSKIVHISVIYELFKSSPPYTQPLDTGLEGDTHTYTYTYSGTLVMRTHFRTREVS